VPRANMLLQTVLGERALTAGQLFERDPNGANVSPRARIFMHQLECELSLSRGELDVAARAVARCVDAGLIDLMWLDHMPALAPLRKDRRYRDLRKIVTERVARIHAALRGP